MSSFTKYCDVSIHLLLLQIRCEENVQHCGRITNLVTVDTYLLVSFATSPDVLIRNTFDGQEIGKISGSGEIKGLNVTMFKETLYLMLVQQHNGEVLLNFYKMGKGNITGDSSDDEMMATLEEVALDDGDGEKIEEWWKLPPIQLSLGKQELVSYTVAPSFIYTVFTFANGDITSILSNHGDLFDDEDDKGSDSSDTDSSADGRIVMERFVIDRQRKKFTDIPNLPAKRKTISVDYYPIHKITCLRSSVLEEFLLTVACTEHMLVIYEMTEGHPILRVRKHYEGASISAQGKYLIAYQGGEIDIFQLYVDVPGIRHFISLDAHSRPIVDLGILGDGMLNSNKLLVSLR